MRYALLLAILALSAFSANLTVIGTSEVDGSPIKVFIGRGYSIIATYQGKIYATTLSGEKLSSYDLGEEVYGMDVSGSVVYLTTRGSLRAFSLNLNPIAYIEIDPDFTGAIKVIGSYAVLADYSIGLFKLELPSEEAELIWGYRGLNGVMPLALEIVNSPYQKFAEVIVGDQKGKLYALALKGDLEGKAELDGAVLSIVHCGRKVAISEEGGFSVLSPEGKLFEMETEGPTFVAFDDRCSLIAVATYGNLSVYDLKGNLVIQTKLKEKPLTLSWSKGVLALGTRGKVTFYVLEGVKASSTVQKVSKVESASLPSLG